MANITKAKAQFIKFFVKDNDENSGDLNISKMYIHKAAAGEPYVSDVTTIKNSLEIDAKSFKISESKVVVHGSKSIQTNFNFNRCYLTNSSDDIIYIFEIQEEDQSEIDIDFSIELKDLVELVN